MVEEDIEYEESYGMTIIVNGERKNLSLTKLFGKGSFVFD